MIDENLINQNIETIICLGLDNISEEYDSIVYYNTLKKEFFASSNNFIDWDNIIEVYRLPKGFKSYDYLNCDDCDNFYTCDNIGGYDECIINKLIKDFIK